MLRRRELVGRKGDALNMDVALDTYFIGMTCQREVGGLARLRDGIAKPACDVYPRVDRVMEFAEPLVSMLQQSEHVVMYTCLPVLGTYGCSRELSVGLELIAKRSYDIRPFAAEVFRQAHANAQMDAFVARELGPGEWTDNTRPGMKVLFEEPRRVSSLSSFVDYIMSFKSTLGDSWPIDGYTTIAAPDRSVGWVAGLRYTFLPEISIRWDMALRELLVGDEHATEIALLDQATMIGLLCRELEKLSFVASAESNWYDVIVGGEEDFSDIIERLGEGDVSLLDPTSMSHKPFSECLGITNQKVIRARVRAMHEKESEEQRHKGAMRGVSRVRNRPQSEWALPGPIISM